MMPPPVVVVVFVVSSSAILLCCAAVGCAAVGCAVVGAMCARGLLGKSEVVYTVLLGQRRCLGSVDRVFFALGPNAGKS